MSTSSFPFDDGTTPEPELFQEFSSMSDEIERRVLDLEPKARELNRHLTALLGRCPSNPDGSWVAIEAGEGDRVDFRLSRIDTHVALSLVARLSEISRILEDNEPGFVPGNRYLSDLGRVVVGEGASLFQVPSTHVRSVKRP